MSSHNVHDADSRTGLLIPHTSYNKKGDKLSQSSHTPLSLPSAVIPIEGPKQKKRKYHPELVDSGSVFPLHLNNPLPPLPSQSQQQSQHGQEFSQALETEWDDGIYVGANNHPLFNFSAVPADSNEAPRRKVSFSLADLNRWNG
jgi:hypothetical protein